MSFGFFKILIVNRRAKVFFCEFIGLVTKRDKTHLLQIPMSVGVVSYQVVGSVVVYTHKGYTPYLLNVAAAQDRPIYDLNRVNALRGPAYSRLDLQFDRTVLIGSQRIIAYAGLENLLDRQNLLGYYWMPRLGAMGGCITDPERCVSAQYQMSRFPNFGLRYAF